MTEHLRPGHLLEKKKSEKSSMAEESMDGEGLSCCVILWRSERAKFTHVFVWDG